MAVTDSVNRMRSLRLAVFAAILLLNTWPGHEVLAGAEPPPVTLESQVIDDAVDNAVRVGPTNLMWYPRIAIDRYLESPRRGTIYVIGPSVEACGIVVSTSVDGGRSFGPATRSEVCLPGPSLDVVIDRAGTLYVASWGPVVLRSADGGFTWENLTTLDTANSPSSLSWDPTTGVLFVSWTNPGGGAWGFHPGTILGASSQDGGRTWTTRRSVLPEGVETGPCGRGSVGGCSGRKPTNEPVHC